MAQVGRLKIQCYKDGTYIPIDGSNITVTASNVSSQGNPNQAIQGGEEIKLTTNSTGESAIIELGAPDKELSLKPTDGTPYSQYDIKIEKSGFQPIIIRGCQIFADELAIQPCNMIEMITGTPLRSYREEVIDIQPNRLNGNYPAKIPEDVDKPLPPPSGGVVLPLPIVPEYIVVHAGGPSNDSAPNYTVPFKDYLKNVASCEIYSTWNDSAIRANIYAIVSFTLNRIYTEWYRGKGKKFDITNSTAYDHAFTYGRNIFESISVVVDDLFATYVRRFGRKQPLLTQYCDGKNVKCPGWMTQWGSQYLAEQGKTPYEILTNAYGTDIELVTADLVQGSPSSYPGFELTVGSTGEPVRVIQEQLNRIAKNYPLIPKNPLDGVYSDKTKESVSTFQGIFNLPKTGIVDYATWYKISDVYVGVTRIAELTGDSVRSYREQIILPPSIYGDKYSVGMPRVSYRE